MIAHSMPDADTQAPCEFERVMTATQAPCELDRVMTSDGPRLAPRISLEQDDVKKGLGQLVLTIVELVRELLERQAIRRMEAGSLSDDEMERVGNTFMRLSEEIERLKKDFGLEGEDLNIDLGPLGKLL